MSSYLLDTTLACHAPRRTVWPTQQIGRGRRRAATACLNYTLERKTLDQTRLLKKLHHLNRQPRLSHPRAVRHLVSQAQTEPLRQRDPEAGAHVTQRLRAGKPIPNQAERLVDRLLHSADKVYCVHAEKLRASGGDSQIGGSAG